MPRYFFHLADGRLICDANGTELQNVTTARREAVVLAAQYVKDHPDELWDHGQLTVTIADSHDMTLGQIAVVAIEAPAAART